MAALDTTKTGLESHLKISDKMVAKARDVEVEVVITKTTEIKKVESQESIEEVVINKTTETKKAESKEEVDIIKVLKENINLVSTVAVEEEIEEEAAEAEDRISTNRMKREILRPLEHLVKTLSSTMRRMRTKAKAKKVLVAQAEAIMATTNPKSRQTAPDLKSSTQDKLELSQLTKTVLPA